MGTFKNPSVSSKLTSGECVSLLLLSVGKWICERIIILSDVSPRILIFVFVII